jgi:hypothetical protein
MLLPAEADTYTMGFKFPDVILHEPQGFSGVLDLGGFLAILGCFLDGSTINVCRA